MNKILKDIYEYHHTHERGEGFLLMEKERGALFKTEIGKGKKVLDIGCRDGVLARYFTEGNTVVGIDVDEQALRRASRNFGIETVSMDLNGQWNEISGRTFDVIVAGEILEHLFYPEIVMQKVKNHLTDSGMVLGSVPNAFNLKNRLRYLKGQKKYTPLEDPTHVNHFSRRELELLLRKHFSSVTIYPLGNYARFDKIVPGWFSYSLAFKVSNKIR
ncbi:MAG: hypothetical protein COU08_02505 [Candidatus Harrisonbacteria bacterium CG10_big_fil_rev_8_21_14_0_10_42_17]|uniref:Class I SAM-dependent methyltransferase n=1 Tax=Candidatus Harrisonbacteria bacterium CG10_big_fil_rev_8_21_14_0_10_42_17 TaxID=1974584 RepID=A0A2M6WI39_9BACT|nr:MAG: hypothetical protein COU08_02505 [Candidatus Harrisonbacteria bacterium CG10_big_fil_rev_8_21_14_0_10_42_17]